MRTERKSRPDYPDGVLGVYDSWEKTADRYTVVYSSFESRGAHFWPYVAMSASPFHPQGIGQHGETGARLGSRECGKTINFADLPADCKRLVAQDLKS